MNDSIGFCDFMIQTPHQFSVVLQQPTFGWSAVLASLATPMIALLGICIAYGQLRNARQKLKFDLYEKRLIVYEAAKNAAGTIVTKGKTSHEIEREFLVGIAGAKWLFDKALAEYLQETLWQEIVNLGSLQAELDGIEHGPAKTSLVDRRVALMATLNKRLGELDDRFCRYMHLEV